MKNVVVLTGAGISAESGISTFRDAGGLWEGYDFKEVASPEGWRKNPALVLDFYNKRRAQLLEVKPNYAHEALVDLEKKYHVQIITQNIDDLHERAGSSKVLHLHGELLKVRSSFDETLILDWKTDLVLGDFCEHNHQLRPHIVWFGEEVPMLDYAIKITQNADIFIIIGTSLQVYPAASLLHFTKPEIPIYYIDPKPVFVKNLPNPLEIISTSATEGMVILLKKL
ncbi:MAG: NAD-dependent protein deacylase [Flavobacteriaceae bacterium CG_4_8_14_3_um_filter_34_10]|nr:NAD-dependent deacylase [Flavobacteriia bacterium]OIP50846.1 MAG: NAD-dependent protein deacylase [Flavobacteriaceae bacterium CG2_30_34_30]PIQ17597.1 MAG: NAD-dependent protein deacylase [Flavobacteriaceae bacterium CG18_big_fil_WC_8_21_14_2_50_34_36]PIX09440.1 MAG: NAD-dependent protein deacylase [Flavobacteriaceae bacterium CG_4_8_14_3_um_filter_34_10]PIZ08498.1 MAG: NAD-dependent protein deacylase [Flavobacteriaceae bacterium CG_4_10_14_0_8_um_filter_34_31]PJC07501.1 MAG: NAD-dependent 